MALHNQLTPMNFKMNLGVCIHPVQHMNCLQTFSKFIVSPTDEMARHLLGVSCGLTQAVVKPCLRR